MDIKSLLTGLGFFTIAHILTWFQLNGQFINSWFRDNSLVVVLMGIPISFTYIYATKYVYEAFGGLVWPGRFIGFSVGMVIFAIFTSTIMGEGLSLKTLVSLALCICLVAIQVLWK